MTTVQPFSLPSVTEMSWSALVIILWVVGHIFSRRMRETIQEVGMGLPHQQTVTVPIHQSRFHFVGDSPDSQHPYVALFDAFEADAVWLDRLKAFPRMLSVFSGRHARQAESGYRRYLRMLSDEYMKDSDADAASSGGWVRLRLFLSGADCKRLDEAANWLSHLADIKLSSTELEYRLKPIWETFAHFSDREGVLPEMLQAARSAEELRGVLLEAVTVKEADDRFDRVESLVDRLLYLLYAQRLHQKAEQRGLRKDEQEAFQAYWYPRATEQILVIHERQKPLDLMLKMIRDRLPEFEDIQVGFASEGGLFRLRCEDLMEEVELLRFSLRQIAKGNQSERQDALWGIQTHPLKYETTRRLAQKARRRMKDGNDQLAAKLLKKRLATTVAPDIDRSVAPVWLHILVGYLDGLLQPVFRIALGWQRLLAEQRLRQTLISTDEYRRIKRSLDIQAETGFLSQKL